MIKNKDTRFAPEIRNNVKMLLEREVVKNPSVERRIKINLDDGLNDFQPQANYDFDKGFCTFIRKLYGCGKTKLVLIYDYNPYQFGV